MKNYVIFAFALTTLFHTTTPTKITFEKPFFTYYLNCYDTTCTTWRACPTETAETVCVKFKPDRTAFFNDDNGLVVGYGKVVNAYKVLTMTTQATYSLSEAETTETPSTVCPASPSLTTADCYTPADACKNPNCPTAMFWKTKDPADLPASHSCLATLFGYGSPYNSPCEPFAAALSPYYSINQRKGNFISDFGIQRVVKRLGCYYENWAKYRPSPYTGTIDSLDGCDVIYYFVNIFTDRQGNLAFVEREEGDWDNMRAIKLKYPNANLVLTFGGWTSNNTIMYEVMTTRKEQVMPQAYALAKEIGFGMDFDVEFPGSRNAHPEIFPLDIPTIISFMREVCTKMHEIKQTCHWGGLAVGGHYHADLYKQLSDIGIDSFNIFGYDMHGAWEKNLYQQSNLYDYTEGEFPNYSLITSVKNMLTVTQASKINLGLGLYARGAIVKDNKIVGPFPTASPLLAAGETGSDIIVEKDGVELPSIFDPATDKIIEDPLQKCYFILERPLATGTGRLMFTNGTTFSCILNALKPFGISNYYLYASSMSTPSSQKYNKLLKQSREPRSISTVYYSFPSTKVTSDTACDTVVLFTDTLMATTKIYEGCHKHSKASSLCFYKTTDFTCKPSLEYSLMTETDACAGGINANTLRPASSSDVLTICNDLKLLTRRVTICSEPIVALPPQQLSISLPGIANWPYKSIPVNYDYEVQSELISKPFMCRNFTVLPTCQELVCGGSPACYNIFSSGDTVELCQGLGIFIQIYNQAIEDLETDFEDLDNLFAELVSTVTATHGVTDQHRGKRFLGAALGFGIFGAITGGIALGVSISNSVKVTALQNDFNNFKNTVDENFNQIEEKFNKFTTSTSQALKEQSKINKAFQKNFDILENNLATTIKGVTAKFTQVDFALKAIIQKINELGSALNRTRFITSAADAAIIKVSSSIAAAQTLRSNVISSMALVRTCLSSVQQGQLGGCVSSGNSAKLLAAKAETIQGKDQLVLLYATSKPAGYIRVQSVASFCDDNTINIAADGCFFTNNESTIMHVNNNLKPCQAPITRYPVSLCPSATFNISTLEEVIIGFERPELPVFHPFSVNITAFELEELQQLLRPNLSIIDELADQIAQIQLQLKPIDTVSGSTFSTWQILIIVAISIAAISMILAMISSCYSCSISSTLGGIFKKRD